MIGFTAYIALKILNIPDISSLFGAILYSQLPYHYLRNEIHIYLASYFMVPFACVALYYVYLGHSIKKQIKVVVCGMDMTDLEYCC